MSDIAAHLVDEVLPEAPVRQWVCSPPWRLRYAMSYDRRLCSDVLAAFVSSLRRSLRHRAKRELGLRLVMDAQIGAITFIQRADSSLRLNVHFHTLVLDGVYVRGATGELRFCKLTSPTAEHVAEVAHWTHERLADVLESHGRSLDELDDAPDELAQDQPALASCYGAAIGDRQLLGADPGQRTQKLRESVAETTQKTRHSPTLAGSISTRGRPSTVVIVDGSSGYVATSRGRRSRRSVCRWRPTVDG